MSRGIHDDNRRRSTLFASEALQQQQWRMWQPFAVLKSHPIDCYLQLWSWISLGTCTSQWSWLRPFVTHLSNFTINKNYSDNSIIFLSLFLIVFLIFPPFSSLLLALARVVRVLLALLLLFVLFFFFLLLLLLLLFVLLLLLLCILRLSRISAVLSLDLLTVFSKILWHNLSLLN